MDFLNFLNNLGRSTLNEEFEQLFSEGVEDSHIFKAIFLQGPNLSGKDFILDKLLNFKSLTEISTIKVFDYLFGKNKLDFSNSDETPPAKSETELREKLSLIGRNGIIINGTADIFEKIDMIKQSLESLGYDTLMIMVNIDDETAKQRNVERGKTGGRVIPEPIRKEKWDTVQNTRAQFASIFQQNYIEFDNSVDLRNADSNTAIQKNQEIQQLLETVQEFLEAEPSSDLAKQWIENQHLGMGIQKESLNEAVTVSFTADTTDELNDLFDNIFGKKAKDQSVDSILSGLDAKTLLNLGKKTVVPENSTVEHTFNNSDLVTENRTKLTLKDVQKRQESILLEGHYGLGLSVKGSDSGLSMGASGESPFRGDGDPFNLEYKDKMNGNPGIRKKKLKRINLESINADGDAISNSTAEPIQDNKKKKGITISTWKANRSIAS